MDAINILFAKLLIEDAANAGENKDFVKSLKLSVLYQDLKTEKNEAGVKALLKHICEAQDQNLFVLEMLCTDQRTNLKHATGRVITRHPDAPPGEPLVSVIINKGYIANPLTHGKYSYRMLSEAPSIGDLRYPEDDAHSNQSRLSGQSQVVGNCGVIAYKEALQIARAFENPQLQKAFFVRDRIPNPSGDIDRKDLKSQFKSLYGFGADRQTRVHVHLIELLLKQLKAKAAEDSTGCTDEQVQRIEDLIKIRLAQKLDRAAAEAGKIPDLLAPFRRISPPFLIKAGLDPAKGDHLAGVKTTIKIGPGVPRYLGLNRSDLDNAKKVIEAINRLWEGDAGTVDEKTNLTRVLLEDSFDTAQPPRPNTTSPPVN